MLLGAYPISSNPFSSIGQLIILGVATLPIVVDIVAIGQLQIVLAEANINISATILAELSRAARDPNAPSCDWILQDNGGNTWILGYVDNTWILQPCCE